MRVRLNQLDVLQVERESGWASSGMVGPLGGTNSLPAQWPPDLRAFELVILVQDEQGRPLSEAFRQAQMRHMIPETIAALRELGEEVVVRLDGPLSDGELVAAFRRLTDAGGYGRFCFSGSQKFQQSPQTIIGSIRLLPTYPSMVGLCGESTLGLERSVRLRALGVPESLAASILEITECDDPRWAEILPQVGFLLGPARGLRSLQILTRRYDAATIKNRVMQRLLAAAPASPDAE